MAGTLPLPPPFFLNGIEKITFFAAFLIYRHSLLDLINSVVSFRFFFIIFCFSVLNLFGYLVCTIYNLAWILIPR